MTERPGIVDSRRWGSQTKAHTYHAIFLADAEDDRPVPGLEATEAALFSKDRLPPLSPGHHPCVPFAFKQLRGAAPVPYVDTPIGGETVE